MPSEAGPGADDVEDSARIPLVHIEPGGPHPTAAHERLSERYQLIEVQEPAAADEVVADSRLKQLALWATGSAARSALAMVVERPDAVTALVLESPELSAEDQDRLSQVETLTLVLFGTDDPASQQAGVFKERLKRCFLVLVYGAGKNVTADRPEAVADMIDDFLQRQERFVVSATPSVLES